MRDLTLELCFEGDVSSTGFPAKVRVEYVYIYSTLAHSSDMYPKRRRDINDLSKV